jgi:trehalose 6-phosphate phosphatase
LRTTFASFGAGAISRGYEPDGNDLIALFLDVDGTLLDLAERPDVVTVPAGLVDSIGAAAAKAGGALALVSGRPIAELDRLFSPLQLRAAGVHGAELRLDPGDDPFSAPGANPLPSALGVALDAIAAEFPGTFVENKRFSYAVHYRQTPAIGDALRARLARLVETQPQAGITMLDAHYAFELKTWRFDKGRAVEEFMSTPAFQGRTPIFIGDDDTDEAGFAAVAALGGRGYSVGRRRPNVVATFDSPSAVRGWLAAFASGGASA